MSVRLALFGGIYNNYLALEAALEAAKALGVDEYYCLGDIGAFGPFPNRSFPLLYENQVHCIQGNYDDSIGNQLDNLNTFRFRMLNCARGSDTGAHPEKKNLLRVGVQ